MDYGLRVFKNNEGEVKSATECLKKAEAKGHALFGLQWGTCYTGPLGTLYDRYGNGSDQYCNKPLGGAWLNLVYKKKGAVEG